jgi:hypothetical protein
MRGMEARVYTPIGIAAAVIVALAALGATPAQDAGRKETPVTTAKGTFDVRLAPQASGDKEMDDAIGRMTIDKRFHGDLDGISKGQMLAVRTAVDGSAGYVAMEKVTGTLHGRTGTFVLQHSGTMTRGAQALTLTVVPDSGTGELTGIAGRMAIRIDGRAHFYEFDYTMASREP